jgi:hypothetical protein
MRTGPTRVETNSGFYNKGPIKKETFFEQQQTIQSVYNIFK